jgi:tyrosine-protein phosphatase SIW14
MFGAGSLKRSVLLAALLSVCLWLPAQAQQPTNDELPNFHSVSEKLYRGAQPRKGGIRKLAELGITTIINLRDDDERAEAEAKEAKAEGIRYFNVPFKRMGRPTDSQIEQVLKLINSPENGVVFVHCQQGQDRTGTVVAIYRIVHEGWTARDAIKEAEHYGMRVWQYAMRDYISDYYRDRQ